MSRSILSRSLPSMVEKRVFLLFRAQAENEVLPDIRNWRKRLKPTGTPDSYGGLSSIHWYGKGEFKRLMRDLAESTTVYGTIPIHDFLGRLRGLSSPSSQRSLLRSTKLERYSFKLISKNEKLSGSFTTQLRRPQSPLLLNYLAS